MFIKLRMKMIEIIAGDEPIFLNWDVHLQFVKKNACLAHIPPKGAKLNRSTLAVLTPSRNADDT